MISAAPEKYVAVRMQTFRVTTLDLPIWSAVTKVRNHVGWEGRENLYRNLRHSQRSLGSLVHITGCEYRRSEGFRVDHSIESS